MKTRIHLTEFKDGTTTYTPQIKVGFKWVNFNDDHTHTYPCRFSTRTEAEEFLLREHKKEAERQERRMGRTVAKEMFIKFP